jgi:hypothetical protein
MKFNIREAAARFESEPHRIGSDSIVVLQYRPSTMEMLQKSLNGPTHHTLHAMITHVKSKDTLGIGAV